MIYKTFKLAFPQTLPILAGFWFVGLAYGLYMHVSGFSFVYPMLMSLIIFGGSLEFITVAMLLSPFSPVGAFVIALLVQARHLFYGISMLDKYKGLGLKKYYLIFGMCDESFSLNFTAKIPEGVDRGWYYFFITFLNHFYWVSGSTVGALIGDVVHLNTKGLEFVMTALFVVIFVEQFLNDKEKINGFIGIGASVLCLLIFKQDNFMIPAMILMLAVILLRYKLKKNLKECADTNDSLNDNSFCKDSSLNKSSQNVREKIEDHSL